MLWATLISISVFASTALGSTIVNLGSRKTVYNAKDSLFNNCKLAKKSIDEDLKARCDRLNGTLLDSELDLGFSVDQRTLCSAVGKGRCETAL